MSNLAKYDPLLFKCPKGPVKKDTKVKFKIELNNVSETKTAYFMLKKDFCDDYEYFEMNKTQNGYNFDYIFTKQGHYWYKFKVVFDEYEMFVNKTDDNYSSYENFNGNDFFQLVMEKDYDCLNSMQGGIIYQIFVDRFCKKGETKQRAPLVFRDDWGGNIKKNTNNPVEINLEVFGGNLAGVISKIDYLKDLGVTTIYLNPIQMANSNHKYNTTDYMKIDDMFGTEETFKELIKKATENDIKIVIDGVYNHTGSDSIYFNKEGRYDIVGAYNSKDSKYYSWYDFEDYPNKYKCWWGIDTLPSINDECEEFQNFIAGENGVLDKFLKLGISGVRLDVVDEINDNFVKKIEQRVHKYGKDKIVIGEVWEDASTKISYSKRRKYFVDNELNSVMNYPFKETIIEYLKTREAKTLVSTIRLIENNYPKVVIDNLMNFLSTHDTSRIYSEILKISDNNETEAQKLYKIATGLLFTLPGVPSIFYGDEYGMQDNDGSSRGCFDWENYNNEIFEWFKKLTKIRKYKVFKDGEINILYSSYGKFVFERTTKDERIIIATNLADTPLNIELEGKFKLFKTNKYVKNMKLEKNEIEIIINEK